MTDPLSNEWEYEFDDDNRPTKITDALNNYVDMTYEDNRLSEISAPANSSSVYRRRTKYEYSDIGRLTGIRTRLTHDRTLSCGAVPPNCGVAATAAVLKYDP